MQSKRCDLSYHIFLLIWEQPFSVCSATFFGISSCFNKRQPTVLCKSKPVPLVAKTTQTFPSKIFEYCCLHDYCLAGTTHKSLHKKLIASAAKLNCI